MIRVKGKYVNQTLELQAPLELAEGTEIDILIAVSKEDLEHEEWTAMSLSRLEEKWDNPQDAIYDDWKKLYGI